MAEVVKANDPKLVFLQKRPKMLGYKIGLVGLAQVVDIDVVAFNVAVSAQLPTLFLSFLHPEQQLPVLWDQRKGATTGCILCPILLDKLWPSKTTCLIFFGLFIDTHSSIQKYVYRYNNSGKIWLPKETTRDDLL